LTDIYPIKVLKTEIKDYEKYKYDVNNSYMIIEDETNTDEENTDALTLEKLAEIMSNSSTMDSSSYFINSIQGYVYSAEELIIDDLTDISTNYNLKQTYIKDNKQHFVINQVIKICMSSEEEIHNNYTKNIIDNETAFRIIDISINDSDEDNIQYTYILDGIFDFYKLNNKIYHNKAEYI
jgi:hypothetical protein